MISMKKEKKLEVKEQENVASENKGMQILKGIGIFLVLLVSYLFIPQIIGSIFYHTFKMNEYVAVFIGNTFYAIGLFIVFRDMFISKIKEFFKNFSEYYGNSLKYWGFGLIAMVVTNLILSYLVFSGDIAANEEANRAFLGEYPIIGLISISILAPFVEEMIFRFGVKKITGMSKWFPLVSAIVFGLPHALTGISSLPRDAIQLLYIIPYGALGYAFGYIYQKYDNIFCSMSVHMTHNLMCYFIILTLV